MGERRRASRDGPESYEDDCMRKYQWVVVMNEWNDFLEITAHMEVRFVVLQEPGRGIIGMAFGFSISTDRTISAESTVPKSPSRGLVCTSGKRPLIQYLVDINEIYIQINLCNTVRSFVLGMLRYLSWDLDRKKGDVQGCAVHHLVIRTILSIKSMRS